MTGSSVSESSTHLLRCEVWLTAQQGSPTCPHPENSHTKKTSINPPLTNTSCFQPAGTDREKAPHHGWRSGFRLSRCLYVALVMKLLERAETKVSAGPGSGRNGAALPLPCHRVPPDLFLGTLTYILLRHPFYSTLGNKTLKYQESTNYSPARCSACAATSKYASFSV